MYSKKAIIQLIRAAINHFLSNRLRRWAYHANVIKIFERISSKVVLRITGITGYPPIKKELKNNNSGTEKKEYVA
jgi:hypothetical protein